MYLLGSVWFTVGLNDLEALFQPKWPYDLIYFIHGSDKGFFTYNQTKVLLYQAWFPFMTR